MEITKAYLKSVFGNPETFPTRKPDENHEEVLENGLPAVSGRAYSETVKSWFKEHFPDHTVDLAGFYTFDNAFAHTQYAQWHEEGADFALVDNRFLVDPWPCMVLANETHGVVYDLQDPNDAQEIDRIYGDPRNWDRENRQQVASLTHHESPLPPSDSEQQVRRAQREVNAQDLRHLQFTIASRPVRPSDVQLLDNKIRQEGLTQVNYVALRDMLSRKEPTFSWMNQCNIQELQDLPKSLLSLHDTVAKNARSLEHQQAADRLLQFSHGALEKMRQIVSPMQKASSGLSM